MLTASVLKDYFLNEIYIEIPKYVRLTKQIEVLDFVEQDISTLCRAGYMFKLKGNPLELPLVDSLRGLLVDVALPPLLLPYTYIVTAAKLF